MYNSIGIVLQFYIVFQNFNVGKVILWVNDNAYITCTLYIKIMLYTMVNIISGKKRGKKDEGKGGGKKVGKRDKNRKKRESEKRG